MDTPNDDQQQITIQIEKNISQIISWTKTFFLPLQFVAGQQADLRSFFLSHWVRLRSPVSSGFPPWSCSWSSPWRPSCPSRPSTSAQAVSPSVPVWRQRPTEGNRRPENGYHVQMTQIHERTEAMILPERWKLCWKWTTLWLLGGLVSRLVTEL